MCSREQNTAAASTNLTARGGFQDLFPDLVGTDKSLDALAEFSTSQLDSLDSKIPAGYTYLSQFVTHDISLDSESGTCPWHLDPSKSFNKRTPFFDLETIYGREKPANAGEPPRSALMEGNSKLKVGKTARDTSYDEFLNDLWRPASPLKAVIVDDRNDENLAVAQTQVAFTKFHNAIVDSLQQDTPAVFTKARRSAVRHYQHIVLYDFLPRFVRPDVLADALQSRRFVRFEDPYNVTLPREFAFAAFRFGHSMVADKYHWNRKSNAASLDELFRNTFRGGELFNNRLRTVWIINWNWFYNIHDSQNLQSDKFNFAKKINTHLATIFANFRDFGVTEYQRWNSIPALDLYRARALGIPSGQVLAERMNIAVVEPDRMAGLLPDPLKAIYKDETPLWFYILAEAELEDGDFLGELGSRIVAETIIELIRLSPFSIIGESKDAAWEDGEFLGTDGHFGMAEMLAFVDSHNGGKFLNPLGNA